MEINTKDIRYTEIKDPEFIKDFNFEESEKSNELLSLMDYATKDSKAKIEKELFVVKNGFLSERNIYSEIKKSRLPLLCLHDIRLEHRGLTIEFDFIIIASEFILMIETKQFIGNLAINFKGNMTREYQFKNSTFKDDISNQMIQRDRNIKFLERFLRDYKLVKDIPIDAIAVIGNDESRFKALFAKSVVKKQYIPYKDLIDQMTGYIKKNQTVKLSHHQMREISNVMMKEHKPIEEDYASKLNLTLLSNVPKKNANKKIERKHLKSINKPIDPSEALLYKTVKDARKDLHKNPNSFFYRVYKKQ